MKKRFLALLLVGVLLIGALASCTSGKKYTYIIDETKFNVIEADGTSKYTIVRPENATNAFLSFCVDLKDAILEKTGVELEIKSDFEKKGHAEFQRQDHEILVGFTNREETEIAGKELARAKDFSIVQSGTRIAILAKSNGEIGTAVNYFIENYIDGETCSVAMDFGEKYVYTHDYAIDSYTINGADITEYGIEYSSDIYKPAVDEFNAYLLENYGHSIQANRSGVKADKMIYIQPADGEYAAIREEMEVMETRVVVDEDSIAVLSGEFADTGKDVADLFSKILNIENVDNEIAYTIESSSATFESENIRIDDTALLEEIDAKAQARREYIMNTPNTFTELPEGSFNKVYYISNNGSDSNDGLSPETAWATIDKMKNWPLMKGDYVLFERGGEFRGKFKAAAGVTYSAYGEGPKPIINGSHADYANPTWWLETDVENVYKSCFGFENVGCIVFDYSGEIGNYDEIYGKLQIHGKDGFSGYQDLDSDLEFCSNLESKSLYIYSEHGNPGKRFSSIEIADSGNIVSGSEPDVTIDNLTFMFGGSHGVGSGDVKNRTVQNCIFAWIGGSILKGFNGANLTRYGNAIEVYGACDGYYVLDNWCYQIYDTGVTHQYSNSDRVIVMDNIEYRGNLVELCHWSYEYYNRGSMPGSRLHNVHLHDNMALYGCYGWGSVGREGGGALHNSFQIIDDVENYVVEDNIFAYSKGNIVRYNEGGDRLITFKNNIYVQYYNRMLGYMFGKNQPYDGSALTQLKDVMNEENPTLVFLMHDAEKEAEEAAKKAAEEAGV